MPEAEAPPELREHWQALVAARDDRTRQTQLGWLLRYENDQLYQLLDGLQAQALLSELVGAAGTRVQQLAFYLLLEVEYQLLMEDDEPDALGHWVHRLPALAKRATCSRVQALASAAHELLTQEADGRDGEDVGTEVDEQFFPAFADTFLDRLSPAALDQLLALLVRREPMHMHAWTGPADQLRDALVRVLGGRGLLGFAALVLEVDRLGLEPDAPLPNVDDDSAPRK